MRLIEKAIDMWIGQTIDLILTKYDFTIYDILRLIGEFIYDIISTPLNHIKIF